jgi:antitoxin component YwqK of YwqJK toxin-antitoxin module
MIKTRSIQVALSVALLAGCSHTTIAVDTEDQAQIKSEITTPSTITTTPGQITTQLGQDRTELHDPALATLERAATITAVTIAKLDSIYSEAQISFRGTGDNFNVTVGGRQQRFEASRGQPKQPEDRGQGGLFLSELLTGPIAGNTTTKVSEESRIFITAPIPFGSDNIFVIAGKRDSDPSPVFGGIGLLDGEAIYTLATAKWTDVAPSDFSRVSQYNGIPSGHAVQFVRQDDAFVKQLVASYKNGKPDGVWTRLFTNGLTMEKQSYRDGLLHGEKIRYFESGKIYGQEFYSNGVSNGSFIFFRENGSKSLEGTYKAGQLNGLFSTFDEKGTVTLKETYLAGVLTGPRIAIGDIFQHEDTYRNGKKFGPTIIRNVSTGKKIQEYTMGSTRILIAPGSGITVEHAAGENQYFSPDSGRLVRVEKITHPPRLLSNNTIAYEMQVATYHAQGTVASKFTETCWVPVEGNRESYSLLMEGKCELDGTAIGFSEGGVKIHTEMYKRGLAVGEQLHYWPNGNPKNVTHYNENGELQGAIKTYAENGKIASRTEYMAGKTQGESILYFPNGKVSKKGILEPGEKADDSVWVEFIEYYESGAPKKQCDFRSNKCVQWDVTGKRFDTAH